MSGNREERFSRYLFGKCGKRIFCCLVCFAGFFINSSELHTQQPLNLELEVLEAVWTTRIDTNALKPGNRVKAHSPDRPLYLWLHLKGGKKALDYMETRGEIPIRVHWLKVSGRNLSLIDDVDISIDKKYMKKLKREFQQRGFFDWRTFTEKINTRPGWIMLKIFYIAGSPILCAQNPCKYEIEVFKAKPGIGGHDGN